MTDSSRAENLTPASRVEELAASFVARYRRGERPSIAEYTRQYPDLAGQIEEIFPALVAIEQVQGDLQGGPPDISPLASVPTPATLGDFRIIREIGRGGMGVVYEAEQISLGRRVALKVLSAVLLSNPQHRKRFQREARAAAQLHHTNIVPVFGVGEQEGVSFYVMQFIQGLGLDDVLKELVQQRSGVACGPTPTADGEAPVKEVRAAVSAGEMAGMLCSGEFQPTVLLAGASGDSNSAASEEPANELAELGSPSLVDTHPGYLSGTGSQSQQYAFPDQTSDIAKSASRNAYWDSIARIGVQVAEALHYAHEQGVVHRDIKPANLLLDTRGVAWVTDFGLAKATDSQDLTHTGDVLGTLRYMAPEQFDGKSDSLSDLYALGLTLYEMLVLRPAFDQKDRQQLIKEVTTGTPPRLRTLEPRIPRDLETIIHKAIERDPAHRYATAGELADDLQRYLGDEPIRARRISLPARLRRWFRRNPAIAGLTTTIALLLAATAVVASFAAVRFERLAENNQQLAGELQSALGDAESNLRLARTETNRAEESLKLATAERQRAEDNVDLALKALDAVYLDAIGTEKLLGVGGARPPGAGEEEWETGLPVVLSDSEKALLKRGLAFYDEFAGQNAGTPFAAEQTARAYFRVGLLQNGLGDLTAAEAAYREAAERFTELSEKEPSNVTYFAELGRTWHALSQTLAAWPDARQALLNARDAYTNAISLQPARAAYYLRRSEIAKMLSEDAEQLSDIKSALAINPESIDALTVAARAHWSSRQFQTAVEYAERAVAIAPERPENHCLLAEMLPRRTNVFGYKQRTAEEQLGFDEFERRAAEAYNTALQLAPNSAGILMSRASFYCDCGKFTLAKQDIDRVQELEPQASVDWLRGTVEKGLGNKKDAAAAFLREAALRPSEVWILFRAADTLESHDPDGAITAYSQVIERKSDWSTPYKRRGALRIERGEYMEGLADLRKAIALKPEDTSALTWRRLPTRPGPPEFTAGVKELADAVLENCPDKGKAHAARGLFFAMRGENAQSEREFGHAVRLSPERPEIFRAWGTACVESGRPQDALPKYARAAELAPTVPDNWTLLGNLALRLGEFAAARDSYSKLLQLRAENFNAYKGRAAAHFHLKDFEAAIADCRQATVLKSGNSGLPISLSVEDIARCPNADFQQQLVDLMAESLTRPEVDAALGNVHLGDLLNAMERREAALRAYEAAVAAGSERHELLHKLAQAYSAAANSEDDPQRREEGLRRAVTYSGKYQAAAASDAGERQEHAYRMTRLAMFLHEEAGRPAEAVEHYDAALATFQTLEADPDAEPSRRDWYRRELGYFEQFLASCHLELGNLEEARRLATSSATRHRDLIERLPDVPDYPERLGWNEALLQMIAEQESSQQPPME